ncbi:hypothetical protein PCASD_02162 [Puccinia coronata f. sp. avenae]|uniref:Uncharacterized protein n=1 Tax=Puccinia coronata f. sp. avenae TaxID=200324 RepID=A0A2N5VQ39_9BASI|nr:hypothetical protein PCASD_20894 [Puccinia coronata f. sp. avenae]PLW52087.1 hypothetical protein PCASD_02162 [Puccinia coronata f. sp. avenae]
MEILNNAAFEENCGTQDSWLTPSPGATKYVPFLDSQTQGSQLVTRSAAALLGAFPLILPTRTGADPKRNAPPQPCRLEWEPTQRTMCQPHQSPLEMAPTPSKIRRPNHLVQPRLPLEGTLPFLGFRPPPCCLQLHPRLGTIPSNPTALRNRASNDQFTSITFYTRDLR